MFRTLSGTADPRDPAVEDDKEPSNIELNRDDSRSSASTQSDRDAVERVSSQGGMEVEEKGTPLPSNELARTTSKALSRVSSRLTTRHITDPGPPPDGGLKAWTQIAMGWLAIVTTWGWINCFGMDRFIFEAIAAVLIKSGVFQTYYTLHLDVSASTISWIGTVQNFLSFFIGAFSGRLLDAGYFLPTVLVGATLQILGIFMMSLSTQYWQLFLTQGLVNGIGNGLFFTPCMGVMATWFSKVWRGIGFANNV